MRPWQLALVLAASGACSFAAQPASGPNAPQAPAQAAAPASQAAAPANAAAVPAGQAAPQAPAAQPLGRLFFSRDERAALDESRRRPVIVAKPEPKPLPPAPEYITLNGVVRRSDGSTVVWLNNRIVEGTRTSDGLEVGASKRAPGPANVTVRVPQAGRSVDLRVGQRLDVSSGKVQERFQVAPPPIDSARPPEAEPSPSNASKAAPRRASRERELLRDLLRDIAVPQSERPSAAADSKS